MGPPYCPWPWAPRCGACCAVLCILNCLSIISACYRRFLHWQDQLRIEVMFVAFGPILWFWAVRRSDSSRVSLRFFDIRCYFVKRILMTRNVTNLAKTYPNPKKQLVQLYSYPRGQALPAKNIPALFPSRKHVLLFQTLSLDLKCLRKDNSRHA